MTSYRWSPVALLLLGGGLATLSGQEGERPAGWQIRLDRAGAPRDALSFVSMAPGYHITTGPAGIFYHPEQTAAGSFRAEAEIHLFDPEGRREAFGIFFGGRNLDGPEQSYTYFLIRNSGQFLVKRRSGAETEDIRPWTNHDAVVTWDGSQETATNLLAVEVGPETVAFLVNGETVASLPRSEVETDGVVGLRVNHRLDLHVSRLEIIPGG